MHNHDEGRNCKNANDKTVVMFGYRQGRHRYVPMIKLNFNQIWIMVGEFPFIHDIDDVEWSVPLEQSIKTLQLTAFG